MQAMSISNKLISPSLIGGMSSLADVKRRMHFRFVFVAAFIYDSILAITQLWKTEMLKFKIW